MSEEGDLIAALDVVEGLLARFEGDIGELSGLGEAAEVVRRVGSVQARSHALVARVAVQVERRGLQTADGHRSVRCWLAHAGRLSRGEASAVVATGSMMNACDQIAKRHATGALGVAQARALARLHRNPRCGDQLVDHQQALLDAADSLSMPDFVKVCDRWEQLADADGSLSDRERHYTNRRFRIIRNYDGSWTGEFCVDDQTGKAMSDIFEAFLKAQRLAETDDPDLAGRSEAQRRADAVFDLFCNAAATPADAQRPEPLVNIVMSEQRAEAYLAVLPDPGGLCEALAGDPVLPADALAALLIGRLRRVIYNSAGVVIDLGRDSRLFRGGAKDAVILQDQHRCLWPGCHRTYRHCEIDHTKEWTAHHGRTEPANGGLLCGYHNRLKQTGFRCWRDPTGTWHYYRPHGTEIT